MKNNLKNRKTSTVILLIIINCLLVFIILLIPAAQVINNNTDIVSQHSTQETTSDQTTNPEQTIPETITNIHDTNNTIPETTPGDNTVTYQTTETIRPLYKLLIIIDDVGYNLTNLDLFLKFPGQMTFAILPHLAYSREAANRITNAGKEVMLHMPMEPQNGMDPGAGAIFVGITDNEIKSRLFEAFENIPQAMGMNNHMGSKVTADMHTMQVIAEFVKDHNKFFLDSRTTGNTVSDFALSVYNLPSLKRDIFLDDNNTDDFIRKQFLAGMEIAKEKGYAVLIGHVQNPRVIYVLKNLYNSMLEQGFTITSVSDLLKD